MIQKDIYQNRVFMPTSKFGEVFQFYSNLVYNNVAPNLSDIYQGKITGAVLQNYKNFNVLYLDGTDDYIDFGNVYGMEGNVDFSLEVVLRYNGNSVSSYPVVVSKEDNPGGIRDGWEINIRKSDGKFVLEKWVSGTAYSAGRSITSLQDGKWYHIVVQYSSAGKMRYYVNGVLDKESNVSNVSINANNSTFKIGSVYSNAARFFNGAIFTLKLRRIYLDAGQVRELYEEWKDFII